MDRKGQYKQPKHEKNNRWAFQPNKASQESRQRRQKKLTEDVLIGRNAVVEALKAGRGINKILLAHGDQPHGVQEIVALAKERGVVVQFVERSKIETLAAGHRHQGVLAFAAPVPYVELDEILARAEAKGEPPFLLLLDELEDPHNLGAIVRTANVCGAHGVVIPKHRAVGLTASAVKASAGAVSYTPVAKVTNLSRTIESLKDIGMWFVCADMEGDVMYDLNLTGPIGLVIGNEGSGVSPAVRRHCDFTARIPMKGEIGSLNASVACGVLCYEIVRQRMGK